MENVEKFVFMLFCFQKQRKQPEITSSACLKILYVQTLLKMPFSSEQEKLIILLFGRFQSSTQVRREFIKHQNLKGRQASELRTQDFDWIIKKFMKNGIKNQKRHQDQGLRPNAQLGFAIFSTLIPKNRCELEVKKSVRIIRKRLEKCAQQDGGHFQHLMK